MLTTYDETDTEDGQICAFPVIKRSKVELLKQESGMTLDNFRMAMLVECQQLAESIVQQSINAGWWD